MHIGFVLLLWALYLVLQMPVNLCDLAGNFYGEFGTRYTEHSSIRPLLCNW